MVTKSQQFVFAQNINDHYFKTTYDFNGAFPEKQLSDIVVDNNGFYWLKMQFGNIVRWDNINEFQKVQSPFINKPGLFLLVHDYLGRPVFTDRHSVFIIDSLSRIQPFTKKPNFQLANFSTNFSYLTYIVRSWEEIARQNTLENLNLFKKIFNDAPYKIQIGPEEIYLGDDSNLLYYDKGRITKMGSVGGTKKNLIFTIGENLVAINKTGYTIYKNGLPITTGSCPQISRKIVFSPQKYWCAQNLKDAFLVAFDSCIYKLALVNNKLCPSVPFHLPDYKRYKSFYWDSANDKLFLPEFVNGFTVYEKKFFFNQSLGDVVTDNIVYTQLIDGKIKLTNQNFQKQLDPNNKLPFVYTYVGVAEKAGNRYFYFSGTGTALFNKHFNIIRKSNVDINNYRIVSTVNTDSVIYFADGRLKSFNKATETVRELQLYKPLSKNTYIRYIIKSKGRGFYAIIDNHVESINLESDTRQQLTGDIENLRSLFYDEPRNLLFIATNGNGFYCLNLANNQLTKMPLDNRGSLQFCHYVIKDKAGDYWMATNSGLFLMFWSQFDQFLTKKVPTVNYFRFGKEDGITNDEFNGGFSTSGMVDGDSLSLASMSGIVSFNPADVKKHFFNVQHKLFLDNILLDDSLVNINDLASIAPRFKKLKFKFIYPHIQDRFVELQYKIEGIRDTSWLPLLVNDELMIRDLDPGDYKLIVRINGAIFSKQVEYNIHINNYWYHTWWANIIWAVDFVFLLFGFATWRKRIAHKKLEIEKLKLVAALKLLRGQLNPHFIHNAFNFLSINLPDDTTGKINKQYVSQLAGYFREVLNITEKEMHSLEDELTFTEAYLRLQQKIYIGFDYKIVLENDFDTYSLLVPTMLLQPFVENCIKHGFYGIGYQGHIVIKCSILKNLPLIEIVDNGKGIAESAMNKFKNGVGYKSAAMRLSAISNFSTLQSFISIANNQTGSGVTVSIKIPLVTVSPA